MSVITSSKPNAKKSALRFETEEAFEAWCNENTRAEYIDGEVIMHSPASANHEDAVVWLSAVLRFFVDKNNLGKLLGSSMQSRLRLGKRRLPDLTFVAKDRVNIVRKTYIDGAPDLIVEFVSPESTVRDWREKYYDYQQAGVKEYWIIDQGIERMDVCVLDEGGEYVTQEERDGKLHSKILPGFRVKPGWLWQKPLPNIITAAKEIGIL